MPDLVSVLIPLFGRHLGRQTLNAVCAAWTRQDMPVEVVVAAAGDAAVTVAGPVRLIGADPAIASPGVLRNLAADRAAGNWLYLSDADVRPVGADYLTRAFRLAGTGALAQPWMFRHIEVVPSEAPGEDSDWDRALQRLSAVPCCFIRTSPDGCLPQVCSDERYVWDGETLMVIPPAELPAAAGELRWRPPFHWGGMLVQRPVFDKVGGYHQGYVGWGCEDDDLLAKVGIHAKITEGWRTEPSLRCVHYEHTRPYDNPGFARNRLRLAQRLADGPPAMIQTDVNATHQISGEE